MVFGYHFRTIWSAGLLITVLLVSVSDLTFANPKNTSGSTERRTIEGNVRKVTQGGSSPVTNAVVMMNDVDSKTAKKGNQTAVMDQRHLEFEPQILPVRVGQTIRFPNSDSQLHNVRLNDWQNRTRLMNKVTPPGKNVTYTPKKPGLIRVQCDIHPSMEAVLIVRSEPFLWANTDAKGRFQLNVPKSYSDTHEIVIWSEETGFRAQRKVLTANSPISVTLQSKSKEEPTNKEEPSND